MKTKNDRKRIALAAIVIALGVVARILLKDVANVEPITLLAILGGAYIGRTSLATLIPLGIVVISDIIIGNTGIALFTWTAWASIGAASIILKHVASKNIFPLAATGAAIATSAFFFIWTNFGVWLTTTMYPKTIAGLAESYTMAIPFFRTHLVSNIMIVASVVTTILIAKKVKAWSQKNEHAMARIK